MKNGTVLYGGKEKLSFIKIRTIIELYKLNLHYRYEVKNISGDLDTKEWEYFWQLHNLISLSHLYKEEIVVSIDSDFVELYDTKYQELLLSLMKNSIISITPDNEGDFNDLTNEQGVVIASAELIIPALKVVFEPFGEKDEDVFKESGYTIKDISSFSISDIKT